MNNGNCSLRRPERREGSPDVDSLLNPEIPRRKLLGATGEQLRVFIMIALSLFHGEMVHANTISLRDKIGQMLIVGFDGKEINNQSPIVLAIKNQNIGGVILFDYHFQTNVFSKNIESPAQVQQLNQDLQQVTQEANATHNRQSLPLLISVDYEGGLVNRLKDTYGFPATVSAAEVAKKTVIEAEQIADRMANTLHEAGFNLNFAPVLDVNTNPDNPVIGKKERSFSSDPATVAQYASIYSRAFSSYGIQCAYKHFPGHGSSTGDSHLGFVDVTGTWDTSELFPWQSLLAESQTCGMVMTAHIVNRQLDESGLPATLSRKILTDILRGQLSFDGVIITDDMQMKAISDHYGLEHALTLAINAGADMFIFGNQLSEKPQDPEQLINIIESKVTSGEISQSRIDDAYRHIVHFKQAFNAP